MTWTFWHGCAILYFSYESSFSEFILLKAVSSLALLLALSLAGFSLASTIDSACSSEKTKNWTGHAESRLALSDESRPSGRVVSDTPEKEAISLCSSTSSFELTELDSVRTPHPTSSARINVFLNWFSYALGAIGSPV